MTLRAISTLKSANEILAEDTRRTRQLCRHYEISTPLASFHSHSSPQKRARILEKLRCEYKIAVTTDAGMPTLSDPGRLLIDEAHDHGIRVEVIPGPSALTAAIAISGVACDRFQFLGFLPRTGARRKAMFADVARYRDATILFESPQRIVATLEMLTKHCPERRVALCRELTKLHEEVIRGTAESILAILDSRDAVKGEITLVIESLSEHASVAEEIQGGSKDLAIAWLKNQPRPLRRTPALARDLAIATGTSRAVAYKWLLAHLPQQ